MKMNKLIGKFIFLSFISAIALLVISVSWQRKPVSARKAVAQCNQMGINHNSECDIDSTLNNKQKTIVRNENTDKYTEHLTENYVTNQFNKTSMVRTYSNWTESNNGVQYNNASAALKTIQNIYYLKIYKTGSTTFHNILFRFGCIHNLKIAVFIKNPYPGTGRPEKLIEILEPSSYYPYNIVGDHAIYNETYPFSYMPKDTVSIALIREPFSRFKSAFKFFGFARLYNLKSHFYPEFEFLKLLNQSKLDKPAWLDLIQNTQCKAFGARQVKELTDNEIDTYIRYIDRRFKLVFTLERFQESLIHLKRTFNWTMFDILYMTKRRRPIEDTPTDDYVIKMMTEMEKRINRADHKLYSYFSSKLNNILEEYGDDFMKEVDYFKYINSHVVSKCQQALTSFRKKAKHLVNQRKKLFSMLRVNVLNVQKTDWHDAFNISLTTCRLLEIYPPHFRRAIRVRQFPASCEPSAGPPFVRPFVRRHIPETEYCANDTGQIYGFLLESFIRKPFHL